MVECSEVFAVCEFGCESCGSSSQASEGHDFLVVLFFGHVVYSFWRFGCMVFVSGAYHILVCLQGEVGSFVFWLRVVMSEEFVLSEGSEVSSDVVVSAPVVSSVSAREQLIADLFRAASAEIRDVAVRMLKSSYKELSPSDFEERGEIDENLSALKSVNEAFAWLLEASVQLSSDADKLLSSDS